VNTGKEKSLVGATDLEKLKDRVRKVLEAAGFRISNVIFKREGFRILEVNSADDPNILSQIRSISQKPIDRGLIVYLQEYPNWTSLWTAAEVSYGALGEAGVSAILFAATPKKYGANFAAYIFVPLQ
jgi:hypothetical protein